MNHYAVQLELSFPDNRYLDKVPPVLDNVVFHPNDILEQVLEKQNPVSRKVFYFLLSQNHLSEPDRLNYRMELSEIYSSSTINSKAGEIGPDVEKSLRQDFQGTVFSVHPEYIRLYFKNTSGNATMSPLQLVSYNRRGWDLRLSPVFKDYLHTYQKATNSKQFTFTKGDKNILLKKLWRKDSDKMYWLIRREQWVRSTITFDIKELKEKLGRVNQSNRNFIHDTLPGIQKELKETWAEFKFKVSYKKTAGCPADKITIQFEKDELILNKIKLNFTHFLEVELYKQGIDISYIQYIKSKIKNQETITDIKSGEEYTWDFNYVNYTLNKVRRMYSNGKVNDFRKLFIDLISKGAFAEEAYNFKLTDPNSSQVGMFGPRVQRGISFESNGLPLEIIEPLARRAEKSLQEYLHEYGFSEEHELVVYKDPISEKSYLVKRTALEHLEKIELAKALEACQMKPKRQKNFSGGVSGVADKKDKPGMYKPPKGKDTSRKGDVQSIADIIRQ